MTAWRVICAIGLLVAVGCRPGRAVNTQNSESEQTVTVSGNDPFFVLEDGTMIGVDGLPPNESMQLKLIYATDSTSMSSVDLDLDLDLSAKNMADSGQL